MERQYELLRKEKLKGLEEQKPKVEENGTSNVSEPPQAAATQSQPNSEENAQQQQEVFIKNIFVILKIILFYNILFKIFWSF